MPLSSQVELERQLRTTSIVRTLNFCMSTLAPFRKKMRKILHLRLPSVVTERREKLYLAMQSCISPLL